MTLVYGVDVSGNREDGNYKYMGIVVCTEEFCNTTIRKLELDKLTISSDKRRIRNRVLAQMQFGGQECLALCVNTEKKLALEGIDKVIRFKTKNLNVRKHIRTYHGAVWQAIREPVMGFLYRHRQGLEDIVFESDYDCVYFLADIGIKRTRPSYAHMFADAVAWANNRDCEPEGVRRIDAVDQIAKRIKKQLK